MPPPKKPKTGLSRVEEYLSATEKEELASQGSVSSPDRTSPSLTNELALNEAMSDRFMLGNEKDKSKSSAYDMTWRNMSQRVEEQEEEDDRDMRCSPPSLLRISQENRWEAEIAEGRSLMQTMMDKYKHSDYDNNNKRELTTDSTNTEYNGKSKLLAGMMKSRKVESLFHVIGEADRSPPPTIDSFESPKWPEPPQNRMLSPCSAGPHTWVCDDQLSSSSESEQQIPLDFSQTAKSVLARMMASPESPPPRSPEEHAELLPPHKASSQLVRFLHPQSYQPTVQPPCEQNENHEAWSPSGGDYRSLSPGEWRPGMPPIANEQNNCDSNLPLTPPSRLQTYQGERVQLLPSMNKETNWIIPPHADMPSSGHSTHWEPEDVRSGEVNKDGISSSTSTTTSLPPAAGARGPSEDQPSSGQEMPTSTMDERRVGRPRYMDKNMNCSRKCQICNDMASGFHYGVWSCEGCKAFFKRSLQGTPVDYVCPATNACTIDKHRRKSCQSCRLRKCIEMGMNRGKKGPRGPRGPNKRKHMDVNHPAMQPQMETGETKIKIKKEVVDLSEPTHPPVPSLKSDERLIHPLAEYLLKIDPPVRSSSHDNSVPDTELSIMSSIMKLADAELVDVINWAKSIPGYTELQLQDRIHLLEASWMEVLLMGLLWRSYPYASDDQSPSAKRTTLVFAQDLYIDEKRAEVSGMGALCEKLFGLVKKFSSLKMHKEEFVLLRALLLFNAEIAVLPSGAKIESLREKLIEALQFTSCQRLHKSPERVSYLLLFLPHIRQCGLTAISHMYHLRKRHSSLPSLELLQEMLEARSPISMPPLMSKRLLESPPHHVEPRHSPGRDTNNHHDSRLYPHPNIPSSPPVGMGAPPHSSLSTQSPHHSMSSAAAAISSSGGGNHHLQHHPYPRPLHLGIPHPRISSHHFHHSPPTSSDAGLSHRYHTPYSTSSSTHPHQ